MRIIALILILLSGAVGFVFSYGFAYREISGALFSSNATMQSSASSNTDK